MYIQLPHLNPMDQQVMALTVSAVLSPDVFSPRPAINVVMEAPCSA